MDDLKLYWLPHCSTCVKALQFLEARGAAPARLRDIKSEPLSAAEIVELAAKVGSAERMFSRRAIRYREMKLNERELSREEMLGLMAGEYTFIKRPVLEKNGRAIAGFSEKAFESFLND